MVTIHGFVADFADVAMILSRAAIAVAPYEATGDSFSQFADPGKLKAYLGAGLPIVLTGVPPNAGDLAASGGAAIVAPDAGAFADEIERVLGHRDCWEKRHRAALAYATRFDWETLFASSLPAIGIRL